MGKRSRFKAQINDQGQMVLPAEVMEALGLRPGVSTQLELDGNELRLLRPISQLARVYIEPTSLCNFDCPMCMRQVWDEPLGHMTSRTFARILTSLSEINPRPVVFFGGYGEPLAHPDIIAMVRAVKEMGAAVELITNGSLLTEPVEADLIQAGLDRLWVSLDGATPESYADVRLGEALPQVLENLGRLWRMRRQSNLERPRVGIAFVAMRRNIAQLAQVIRLGRSLGADRFSISNVLAHTPELREEILYESSLYALGRPVSAWDPQVDLPRMDADAIRGEAELEALSTRYRLAVARQPVRFGGSTCPFIEKGSTSIRWDGMVSPCLPLLHSHTSYLDRRERRSTAFSIGSLESSSLTELWNSPSYTALRERLQSMDFSPCVYCNSCDMVDANQEDCFGNTCPGLRRLSVGAGIDPVPVSKAGWQTREGPTGV